MCENPFLTGAGLCLRPDGFWQQSASKGGAGSAGGRGLQQAARVHLEASKISAQILISLVDSAHANFGSVYVLDRVNGLSNGLFSDHILDK